MSLNVASVISSCFVNGRGRKDKAGSISLYSLSHSLLHNLSFFFAYIVTHCESIKHDIKRLFIQGFAWRFVMFLGLLRIRGVIWKG